MRGTFPGYFQPTERDFKRLWESCLFTVDANILLNFYRYSDDTRNEVLRVFSTLKDRLWLPHQAAQEYFENRLSVIAQQEKTYDQTAETMRDLRNALSNPRQHPFLSKRLMERLSNVLDQATEELEKNKRMHSTRIHEDEIRDAIGVLFEGRVGQPYTTEELTRICGEGEKRYATKVPPGYRDERKSDEVLTPSFEYRRFGDLIIWRQLIDKAKAEGMPVIFLSDDRKEDWWLIFKGKTLGPRPELIKEFLEATEQRFYMYQADRFVELAARHFKEDLRPEIVDEIRDLRVQESKRVAEIKAWRERMRNTEMRRAELLGRIRRTQSRIARLSDYKREIERSVASSLENFGDEVPDLGEQSERMAALSQRTEVLDRELHRLVQQLAVMEAEYEESRHRMEKGTPLP